MIHHIRLQAMLSPSRSKLPGLHGRHFSSDPPDMGIHILHKVGHVRDETFLELKLDCNINDMTSEQLSRGLSLTGTSPQVIIINSIPQTRVSLASVFMHSQKCNETLWAVPVPMLEHTRISVATVYINCVGLGYFPQISKTTVIFNPKRCPTAISNHCQNTSFPLFIKSLSNNETGLYLEKLHNSSAQTARFETARSVEICLPPFSNNSIMIVTENHFRTVRYIQLIKDELNVAKRVCESSEPEIRVNSIVTLSHIVLAATDYGLLEISLVESRTQKSCANIQLDECIKMIRFNWNRNKKTYVLALIDLNSTVFYSMNNQHYDTVRSNFHEMQDKYDQKLCATFELRDARGCEILDVSINDVTEIQFIFLVKTVTDLETTYFLYSYVGPWFENGVWHQLYSLPNDFCSDILRESVDIDELKECNSTFFLDQLTFTRLPTLDFYVFGDILIHGNINVEDKLTLINSYKERKKILVFTSSHKGTFAFLTEDHQLWVGNIGLDDVRRIRPSNGWDIQSSMLRENPTYLNTLTINHDETGNLYEVVLEEKDGELGIKRHVLKVGDVLIHEAFRKKWYHETKQEMCELPETDCGKCSFDSLLLKVTDEQFYKRERVYMLPAPTSTSPLGDYNQDALSAYHNIVKILTVDVIKYSEESTYNHMEYDFMKGLMKKMKKEAVRSKLHQIS